MKLDKDTKVVKEAIARSAASVWCRCYKCDGIVNETGLKCEKPDGACQKWFDAYKGALIAIDKLRTPQDVDKSAAIAEAESWAGSQADAAFLAGVFFALHPDKYNPVDFTPVEEYFRNPDKQ